MQALNLCYMQTFWHSSSHILGQALELEFGVDLTIGPSIEEGFYYDCYLEDGRTLTDADKAAIEKRMQQARLPPHSYVHTESLLIGIIASTRTEATDTARHADTFYSTAVDRLNISRRRCAHLAVTSVMLLQLQGAVCSVSSFAHVSLSKRIIKATWAYNL